MMRIVYRFLREFGLDARKTFLSIKYAPRYFSDLIKLRSQIKNNNASRWEIGSIFPCLHDKSDTAGKISGHYFHQDLFVAQKIFKSKPKKHVDIGSSINGFVAHVASYRDIEVFDIRRLKTDAKNIIFKQMDLMKFDENYLNYTDSISCLHALEHFGLGRYGDDVDLNGYIKGFKNVTKMLKPNGIFYFSVPIGWQRIEFNAHRVFSVKETLKLAKENGLNILSFSYIDDKGGFHKNIELCDGNIKSNFGCNWGCGIWEFRKV
jgi:hypothetical protein